MVEREIYKRYLNSGGKTKALFGIIEMGYYDEQLLIVFGGVISLLLALIAYRQSENRNLSFFAIILSLITITLPFLEIWKLFI